jgi:hypothetical protein
MGQHSVDLPTPDLGARAVAYSYRYCQSCCRELPARHNSCPHCARWLGEKPFTRTEWQLVPQGIVPSPPAGYELIGASALVLRLVCAHPPDRKQMVQLAEVINDLCPVGNDSLCEISGHGWLAWTAAGLRCAFRQGRDVEQRMISLQPRLEKILSHVGGVRWGIWIDQYIVPVDITGAPRVNRALGQIIFNFEPDNALHASEALYRINHRWEQFVSVPRRLLNGEDVSGYLTTGPKRPSALDHGQVSGPTSFVGRKQELAIIENSYRLSMARTTRLAITASAGSGKTRLIAEWRHHHPEVRSLTANFSLFGGDIESFAGQLAPLPPARLDEAALIEAVVARLHADGVKALVFDDLHWSGPDGLIFLRQLVAALSSSAVLVILAARPSGRHFIEALAPTVRLVLKPLPAAEATELARQLTFSAAVARAAAARCQGNPLFVEQFVAWAAEARFAGGGDAPRNLHQLIAARIGYLLKGRMEDVRMRWRWGGSWQRQLVQEELNQLEREIGLWLDRLETGDYADRVEAACHLSQLERLEYEIFLLSAIAGRARPRSSRLREAVERLLIGSANEILTALKRRAVEGTGADQENVAREAQRAGDVIFDARNWRLAHDFYQLALSGPLCESSEIAQRLSQCRRHSQAAVTDDGEVYSAQPPQNLEQKPNVDALDLPYAWADLGRRFRSSTYFLRASEAAEAINDTALAAWAQRKAKDTRTKL